MCVNLITHIPFLFRATHTRGSRLSSAAVRARGPIINPSPVLCAVILRRDNCSSLSRRFENAKDSSIGFTHSLIAVLSVGVFGSADECDSAGIGIGFALLRFTSLLLFFGRCWCRFWFVESLGDSDGHPLPWNSGFEDLLSLDAFVSDSFSSTSSPFSSTPSSPSRILLLPPFPVPHLPPPTSLSLSSTDTNP
jgi:hypothetical protein